jgi:hypothetical protein
MRKTDEITKTKAIIKPKKPEGMQLCGFGDDKNEGREGRWSLSENH